MRRTTLFAAVVAAALALPAHAATPGIGRPQDPDPDVAPRTTPVATVTAFRNERYRDTEGVRTRKVTFPRLPKGRAGWDRVLVTFTGRPDGDPYDRLFGVSVSGVEVLRGTTPRTTFTVRKDLTELAALFPSGAKRPVSLLSGAYLGAQLYTVSFEFYLDEPTAPLFRRAGQVVAGFAFAFLDGDGKRARTSVRFPATVPARAYVDLTLTGHTPTGEFWYLPDTANQPTPRVFHVKVGGVEVGTVVAAPYVYALVGFSGSTGTTTHGPMWWTAQQALDAAGAHTGVGEIPPYRVEVPADLLPLLTGRRTLEVVQENGGPHWVASLRVVLP